MRTAWSLVAASLLAFGALRCNAKRNDAAAPSATGLADAGDVEVLDAACCIGAQCGTIVAGVCHACCEGHLCGLPPRPDGRCQGPTAGPSSSPVYLRPLDVTTAARDEPLELVMQPGFDAAELDAGVLEPLLALRTFPELAPVPFTTATQASEMELRVTITPQAPLVDRWYLLSLASAPPGTYAQTPSANPAWGAAAVRFHPGSAPVRRSVTLCDTKGVIAEMSEPVRVDETVTPTAFDVKADGRLCALLLPQKSPGQQTLPAQKQLSFPCLLGMTLDSRVTIDTRGPLRSPSGVDAGLLRASPTTSDEVIDLAPRIDTFDFAQAPAVEPGCRTFYE